MLLRILLVSLAVAQAKDVPNGHEIEAPGLASSQTSWVDLTRKITMVMQNGAGDDHVALAVTGHRRKLDHDECADGSSDWHYHHGSCGIFWKKSHCWYELADTPKANDPGLAYLRDDEEVCLAPFWANANDVCCVTDTGAVVGAAVGGAVGLLLVVGAILYCSIFLACCACCPCNKKKGQA